MEFEKGGSFSREKALERTAQPRSLERGISTLIGTFKQSRQPGMRASEVLWKVCETSLDLVHLFPYPPHTIQYSAPR
jgi:hypothetical protein